jgi:hypothetical protein
MDGVPCGKLRQESHQFKSLSIQQHSPAGQLLRPLGRGPVQGGISHGYERPVRRLQHVKELSLRQEVHVAFDEVGAAG